MLPEPLYYFDTATTSWPKSPHVRQLLARYYEEPIGTYGRSTDPATLAATASIELLRDEIAQLLGAVEPTHISFNSGATESLNTILSGLPLREGDTVWVSPMEHNAVMRPLCRLQKRFHLTIATMPAMPDGRLDLERMRQEVPQGVVLAIINAESNVNGVIQPLAELSAFLEQELGIPTLLDTAQYLGYARLPSSAPFSYISFSGHKGLGGATGVGGFYVANPLSIEPLILGGNGIHSENTTEVPQEMPERFMAGTPNMLGLAALAEAVAHPMPWGTTPQDWNDAIAEVASLEGVQVYHAMSAAHQGPLFSITHDRYSADELANALRYQHNILSRDGLHCAPCAHQWLGTLSRGGTLRLSFAPAHTTDDLQYLLSALGDVLR